MSTLDKFEEHRAQTNDMRVVVAYPGYTSLVEESIRAMFPTARITRVRGDMLWVSTDVPVQDLERIEGVKEYSQTPQEEELKHLAED